MIGFEAILNMFMRSLTYIMFEKYNDFSFLNIFILADYSDFCFLNIVMLTHAMHLCYMKVVKT